MSLRLQNKGQKKLTDCTDAHGVFSRIFLTFVFRCKGIINGFASVTACGYCDVLIVLWYIVILYILSLWEQVPPTCKIRQIRAISVRKKTFAYIKLNTNIPNQTNHLICRQNQRKIRLKSPLSCQGTIKIKRKSKSKSKFKSKRKIKKRIREKTPLHLW